MNVRTFKKEINDMKKGEIVYINSINLSITSINMLREFIRRGILIPDINKVNKVYADSKSVMQGVVILPQMDYIKN